MIGKAVPLVLVPRYTTYVGESTFTTAPLRVSEYVQAHVTLWRGPLIGAGRGGSFTAEFQVSHDGNDWENAIAAVTTVNRSNAYDVPLSRRWLRLKVTLSVSTGSDVGITLWATGLLEKRIPRGGAD